MSALLLTDQERERFVSWLEVDVASSKAILEQMKDFSVQKPMIERTKLEILASMIVLKRLRTVSIETISNPEPTT